MNLNVMIAVLLGLAAGLQEAMPGDPPWDEWYHEGDADGDGLRDSFETAYGLDPAKVSSFADGVADEDRSAPEGRTMWEVQQAEEAGPLPAGGDSHAGGCGATGAEVLILLAAWGLVRRRRGAPNTN